VLVSNTTVFLSTIDRAHTVHRYLYEHKRALDVIIVDEAGAVPEWKMPTLAVCGGGGHGGGGNDRRGGPELIILVGDQKQLPPFSHNRDETPPMSVLEKMAKALHKGSVKMLQTQYRMPPEICNFISDRFYDRALTTAEHKLKRVSQDFRRSNALEWIDYTHGRESQEGTSKYNETELDIIVDLLSSRTELASKRLSAASEKVMVITFYAAQARRLQDRLQQASRPDVLVMTVDSAQGSETDYVILSCVRCNGGHDIGRFVADDRRVNVAMSRARKQLIVVGSSKTLVRRQQYGADLWSAFKKHTAAAGITTVWGDNAIKVASSASSISSMSTQDRGGEGREERYAGYKVKLCRKWTVDTGCPFGVRCTFAHGEDELRCHDWTQHNHCFRGGHCRFRHYTEDPVAAAKALNAMQGCVREREVVKPIDSKSILAQNVAALLAAAPERCIAGTQFKQVYAARFGVELDLQGGKLKDLLYRLEAGGSCVVEQRPQPRGPPNLFVRARRAAS
jgi:hypothetical protein